MPRPTTLKQSVNNNIRKEAAAIFNKIKVAANEGYKVLPPMDKERYGEIPGLEGPFTTLSGKVVYYDPKEGAYYDRDTDMYLSADEYTALNSDYSDMKDERDIKVREADTWSQPMSHPNYMDTKNNPEIASAFEKQRQNWLKTNPWGGDVDDLNDLVNFGNKAKGYPKAAATLTKQSMDYFKNNPGRGLGEADLDEKAKWRSSSAAKKITDPDKDLGMADYDYHHENPRSTGRLQSIADTEPLDGSINNRQKSKINSKGDRKGKISKADINRVKSNAFNTLNKEETEVDEAGRHLDYVPRKSSNTEVDVKGTKVPIKKHSWGDWEVPYGPYKDIGQHKSKESLVNALHTRIKEEVDENAWNQLGQKKPVGDILPAPAKGSVPNHGKKFKEGDIVIPHAGPHAGVKHKVVFSRVGSVNMIPLGLSAKEDKYNSATVRAKHEHLSPYTKPDFLDMDKDGDKEEPMKKAAADSKKKVSEAPLLGPQGKIHRAASADQSDREYASQKSFKDAWTAKNVGKKWPGYSEAGYKRPTYKKEESAVTEAVTLDYSRYMRAHGKKPRDAGMGSSTWMFTTAEFGNPSEDEIFQFQGSFADAKKAAAKWAKSQGEYRFYVME